MAPVGKIIPYPAIKRWTLLPRVVGGPRAFEQFYKLSIFNLHQIFHGQLLVGQ
jgi:hypothetical protein